MPIIKDRTASGYKFSQLIGYRGDLEQFRVPQNERLNHKVLSRLRDVLPLRENPSSCSL